MPRRTRSHEIEAFSRNLLHNLFERRGWVVWNLYPDYGEDLFVRIFIDGLATQFSFFVQAKATESIGRYIRKDNTHLRFPIKTDHLEYWSRFWEPVILTVWDEKSNTTYWTIIQDCPQAQNLVKSLKKNIYIDIPLTNILDEEALNNILAETRHRFRRFEIVSQGAEILRDLLKKNLGVEVEYTPGDDIIMIPNEGVGGTIITFGETLEVMVEIAKWRGISTDKVLSTLVGEEYNRRYYEEHTEAGEVIIKSRSDGEVIQKFETIEEWKLFMEFK